MKLFLKTNDVDVLREIRQSATNRLLLGVITDVSNHKQLKHFADIANVCVAPICSYDPDEIVKEASVLKGLRENIIPAIQFGKNVLPAVNWLAEQRYKTFVFGVHNGAQALFAAQVGAKYVAANTSELLGSCLETVGHYGGGVDVPYGESWETAIVRMSAHTVDDVYDAIHQGADACSICPEVFWEVLDSTATIETKLLCEDNENHYSCESTQD